MGQKEPHRETRMEAAKAGRRRYLADPCPVCEEEVRYTSSGQCVTCTKERASRYTEEIRSRLREAQSEAE